MKTQIYFWLVGLLLICSVGQVVAQPTVPVNEKAREYVSLGKKYLKFKRYEDAARTFQTARELPFNQLTTASILYEGIAWFRMEEWANAQKRFDELITIYPKSKYTEDALYHQALMMLEAPAPETKEKGLTNLFDYVEIFTDEALKEQMLSTAKYYVFHKLDLNFLNNYYIVAPERHKLMILEGIISQLTQDDQGDLVKERIQLHEAMGGKTTQYMSRARLHFSGVSQSFEGPLRVAIMLPFHLERLDTARRVPEGSQTALNLFEGMQLGMDSLARKYDRPITAMVFDTKGDPEIIQNQLRELEEFIPHFIIGDVRNKASRPIAAWAEQMGIVQMVPLSPSLSLVKDRQNIFLSHPSVERHAEALAEYAFKQRNHRDFVVFNDGTKYPALQAAAFSARIDSLGGRVVKEVMIPTGELNKDRVTHIAEQLNMLKGLTFDAIYVPLSSEEHAGLIVSRMNWIPIKTFAYGSPDWEYFKAIDPELMETFELTISVPFYPYNDSLSREAFRLYYYDHFNGGIPVQENIEGFDMIHHLLLAVEAHNPLDAFSTTLEKMEPVVGIHQTTKYSKQHVNQAVNIVQMIQNRWVKVNQPPVRDEFDVKQPENDPNNPE